MKIILLSVVAVTCCLITCTWDILSPEEMPIPCVPVIGLMPNDADSCFTFSDDFEDLTQVEIPGINTTRPVYSPYNDYEVILAYNSDTFPQSFYVHYIKANFCTGEWVLTYPSIVVLGQASWSKKDWVLIGNTGPVFKMKSNGDSLTYLNEASGISNLSSATWIEGGEKIFCYAGSGIGFNLILDKNGNPLDTLICKIALPDCLGHVIAGFRYLNNDRYICTYDLWTQTLTNIAPIPPSPLGTAVNTVAWLSPEEIIWSDDNGIHKVTVANGIVTTLKSACDSNRYYNLTVSPLHNGDFLVDHYEAWVANDTAWHKGELLKINAYTGQEWVVNLAQ